MRETFSSDEEVVEAVKARAAYIDGVPAVGRALIRPHTTTKGSRISILDDDVVAYPAQDPMRYYVDGNPATREGTDYIAEKTEPRYPDMIERLGAKDSVKEAIRIAIELQKQGASVLAITPHAGDIIDTAYGMKTGLDLFDDQGYEPSMTMFNLSKAIAWGEYDADEAGFLPMMNVVSMLAKRVYLPWPRTESSEGVLSRLPTSEVDRHNRQLAEDTNILLAQGVYGAMSPSGSTRNTANSPNTYRMSRVNKGTMKLMMHPNLYVMPMPMWRLGNEYVTDCLPPVKIRSSAEGHAVMEIMASSLTRMLKGTDKTFHYARTT
jgi:hypothetical protein